MRIYEFSFLVLCIALLTTQSINAQNWQDDAPDEGSFALVLVTNQKRVADYVYSGSPAGATGILWAKADMRQAPYLHFYNYENPTVEIDDESESEINFTVRHSAFYDKKAINSYTCSTNEFSAIRSFPAIYNSANFLAKYRLRVSSLYNTEYTVTGDAVNNRITVVHFRTLAAAEAYYDNWMAAKNKVNTYTTIPNYSCEDEPPATARDIFTGRLLAMITLEGCVFNYEYDENGDFTGKSAVCSESYDCENCLTYKRLDGNDSYHCSSSPLRDDLILIERDGCGPYRTKVGDSFLSGQEGTQIAAGNFNPERYQMGCGPRCGLMAANMSCVRFKKPGTSSWTYLCDGKPSGVASDIFYPFKVKTINEGGVIKWQIWKRSVGPVNDRLVWQSTYTKGTVAETPIYHFSSLAPGIPCTGNWFIPQNADDFVIDGDTPYYCDTGSKVGSDGFTYRVRVCSTCDQDQPKVILKDIEIDGNANGQLQAGEENNNGQVTGTVTGGLTIILPEADPCTPVISATRSFNDCTAPINNNLASSSTDEEWHIPEALSMEELKLQEEKAFRNMLKRAERINDIKVYPNPSKDQFNVSLPVEGYGPSISIYLHDLSGRISKIISRDYSIEKSGSNLNINTQDLPPGVYLLRIDLGSQGIQTQRIVKM